MAIGQILEFTAAGSARQVAQAIEDHARIGGTLHAIVVPWEREGETLSMAVTSVKADGWAIEHTNLATIRLTDLGHERTRVAVIAQEPKHPDKEKLISLLESFAGEIQQKFHAS